MVRSHQPADDEPVRRLLTAAFARPAVAALAEELRHSDSHRAALVAETTTKTTAETTAGMTAGTSAERTADTVRADPLLAGVVRAEPLLAGVVQLSRGWLDAPRRLVEVLVLSPLAVLPALHGRGIGASLVRAAITRAGELDTPLLFLEGSPRYYPRFGFEPAGRHGFLRPSLRIPEPAFQVLRLPARQDWMVGALVYPDPFWRHDSVGLRETLGQAH